MRNSYDDARQRYGDAFKGHQYAEGREWQEFWARRVSCSWVQYTYTYVRAKFRPVARGTKSLPGRSSVTCPLLAAYIYFALRRPAISEVLLCPVVCSYDVSPGPILIFLSRLAKQRSRSRRTFRRRYSSSLNYRLTDTTVPSYPRLFRH